jgi:hypothetical protein
MAIRSPMLSRPQRSTTDLPTYTSLSAMRPKTCALRRPSMQG